MLYGELGLTIADEAKATPGYTLYTPTGLTTTYLLNMRGEVVHEWDLPKPPGNYTYLLPNGNLLGGFKTDEGPRVAAKGGLMQEIDWDGNVVWEYVDHTQHHDFRRLSNGNTIYIGLEDVPDDILARIGGGRAGSERKENGGMMTDYLREVNPSGETVWEWHSNDEMTPEDYSICPLCSRDEWGHTNSVAEDADGNILISWRQCHLVAVIDKVTKKFSWEMQDIRFGHQHDFQQVDNGNYLMFANGSHTNRGGPFAGSQILEIDPATKEVVWEFVGHPPHTFNSPHISGCQRLPSGNTLICEGNWGRLFEVTPEGEIVWNFVSPVFVPEGDRIGGGRNSVFRCYRYAADSGEIGGRLNPDPWAS